MEYEVSYDGSFPVRVVAQSREEAIDEFLATARASPNDEGPFDRELCEVMEAGQPQG